MNFLTRLWRSWRTPLNAQPEVFVHDPAAAKPHNLDDPFDNPEVQQKVGELLAAAARDGRREQG
jgi:hypothetical protein